MIDLTDKERREVLGEILMDELKVIHEYVSDIPVIKADVHTLKEDVSELKNDMKLVKSVVRGHEGEIHSLKQAAHK